MMFKRDGVTRRGALVLAAAAAMTFWIGAQGHSQAQGLDAGAVTDKVQLFYQEIKDYQASFEQIYTDVAAGDEKKSQGKVFFKKPGKMRWDYLTPQRKLEKVLVSDGKAFTIYEAEYDQYYRQCLGDSQLPSALRFLMGTGDLKAEFDVAFGKKAAEGTYKLELTPKEGNGKYKKIHFVVDQATFAVLETIIHDPYGNTNRIVFKSAATNKSLPDAGFNFVIPEGVTPLHNSDKIKCD